jgi:hypothetical protein
MTANVRARKIEEREKSRSAKKEREKSRSAGARKRERKSAKFKAQKRARRAPPKSAKAQARSAKKSACPALEMMFCTGDVLLQVTICEMKFFRGYQNFSHQLTVKADQFLVC